MQATRSKALAAAVAAAFLTLSGAAVQAAELTGGQTYTPYILSGGPPDSPAQHVNPNNSASAFSGVVSINIRYTGDAGDGRGVRPLSFICSGALVGTRQVVSAGHCVDTTGNGTLIDVTQPFNVSGSDVRVVFNSNGSQNAVITASAVAMHPDYKGFGNCPAGTPGFCVNDDISVITLSQDAPSTAKIYSMYGGNVGSGQQITMAGYGTSGDGINGFTISPSFTTKRTGQNIVDIFEGDDEKFAGFDANGFITGGANEVYYADFDGVDSQGQLKDSFCTFYGVCSPILPILQESNIGGGDSGGPSFISYHDQMLLVANNTFGSSGYGEEKSGAYGAAFGGILLASYLPWLQSVTGNGINVVPAPGSLMLLGLGLAAAGLTRRAKRS